MREIDCFRFNAFFISFNKLVNKSLIRYRRDHIAFKMMQSISSNGKRAHACIINIGHFRSGTTTLAEAVKSLGMKTYRQFPDLPREILKLFLYDPTKAVSEKFDEGFDELVGLVLRHHLVCDGWFALFPFLNLEQLARFKNTVEEAGVRVIFVATLRNVDQTVQSELQHWVVHDLAKKVELDKKEHEELALALRSRAETHRQNVVELCSSFGFRILALTNNLQGIWPRDLSAISDFASEGGWHSALQRVGRQNANPDLPLEGILLTMRLCDDKSQAIGAATQVTRLLDQIECDPLCRYLIVIGIDPDEFHGEAAQELRLIVEERQRTSSQLTSVQFIQNDATKDGKPFAICPAWNAMAKCAWEKGAHWVVLLGDDVEVQSRSHYQAIYRSFLDTHPFWPGSVTTLSSHFFNWAIGDGSLFKRFPEFRYFSFPNLPETFVLLLPLAWWTKTMTMLAFVCLPSFLIVDFLVDFFNATETKHRRLLLTKCKEYDECDEEDKAKWARSSSFYFFAHLLANIFVVVLECGRLYGHTRRGELHHGFCQRFDWHCGKLPKSRRNFRKKELFKFTFFVLAWIFTFRLPFTKPESPQSIEL